MSTETLNFVVVGHVDHGKSTLIGRLLYDTNSVAEEKMDEIRKVCGDQGDDMEFAFLLDHLEEERTQHITIDTAQVFFKTFKREYVIIDAPGHKEFLKNMITGASQADAAVLLVDAEQGIRDQTYRHAHMLGMLGISQLVVIINKMDLVNYDRERFEKLSGEITELLGKFGRTVLAVIPASASQGENVAVKSDKMDWYDGPTILESLDQLAAPAKEEERPLRFPVQDTYELNGRRFLLGRIVSGSAKVGEKIVFQPSGVKTTIKAIEIFNETRETAGPGESIAIELAGDELPGRGEIGCPPGASPVMKNELTATVFWMNPNPLKTGEHIEIRLATQEVPCRVAAIRDVVDVASLADEKAVAEELHEAHIASVDLQTERPLCIDPYEFIPEFGRCVFSIDGSIVGGGIFKE